MVSLQVALCLLSAMIGVTGAIQCYQCNSNVSRAADIQSSCNDPFNTAASGIGRCDGNTCVKGSGTNYGQTYMIRGCQSTSSSDGCSFSFGGQFVAGVGCSCSGNLCNAAHKLQVTPTVAATIAATVTALVAARQLFK